LRQISTSIRSLIACSMPARSRAAASAATRAVRRPSVSPKMKRGVKPVCRIRPGAASTAEIWATPPTTWAGPRLRLSAGTLSTPFWNVTTPVSGFSSGRHASAAASVS
jgi:hypothetical protein